jgi:hypothetical protein
LFWSCLIPFVVVLLFILFPTLTMGSLRFLGHGGELTICYAPGIQLQDYSDDITAMSRSDKHTTPYLTNNIRGRLVYLNANNAYIQLLPRTDTTVIVTDEVGGKTIPGSFAVLRGDYLSAGYHLVEAQLLSGDC